LCFTEITLPHESPLPLFFFGAAFAAYDYFGAPVGDKIIFTDLNKAVPSDEGTACAVPAPAPKADETPREIPPIPQDMPAPAKPAEAKPVADAPPAPAEPATDASGFSPPKYDALDDPDQWLDLHSGHRLPPPRAHQQNGALQDERRQLQHERRSRSHRPRFRQWDASAGPDRRLHCPCRGACGRHRLEDRAPVRLRELETLRTAALKRAHERRLANQSAAPAATPAATTDPAVTPERASDGSYPLLVAHLNSGEVTEVKAKNIHQWGTAETMMFEGKPAWSIKVQVDVDTVFGKQPAEVQCIVASGRAQRLVLHGIGRAGAVSKLSVWG